MCERAIKLQKYIDEWLVKEIALKRGVRTATASNSTSSIELDYRDLQRLQLSSNEWKHLEVITEMLGQFKKATSALSEIQKPQIQHVWLMYDMLFDYIETMSSGLDDDTERQPTEWPSVVEAAVQEGKKKLSKYYARTSEDRGLLYNCGVILDPTTKLTIYKVLLSQIFITVSS